jgi:hypothetical protein
MTDDELAKILANAPNGTVVAIDDITALRNGGVSVTNNAPLPEYDDDLPQLLSDVALCAILDKPPTHAMGDAARMHMTRLLREAIAEKNNRGAE